MRHASDGIGELRDPVQGIGRIDRLLPEGIHDAPQPSRRIEHPFRFSIQGIFDFDQIPQFVRERGRVVQRIGERERLALLVHRERRDLAKRVGTERTYSGICYLSAPLLALFFRCRITSNLQTKMPAPVRTQN